MKSVVAYAQKAHENNPSDAKMSEFYNQVKREYEGIEREDKKEEVKQKEDPKKQENQQQ